MSQFALALQVRFVQVVLAVPVQRLSPGPRHPFAIAKRHGMPKLEGLPVGLDSDFSHAICVADCLRIMHWHLKLVREGAPGPGWDREARVGE